MKKIVFTACTFLTLGLFAQQNLVPNPSFEEVEKKIKEGGQIELAVPWTSATFKSVDLYSADSKNKDFGVPTNAYGMEKAQDGNNYVGINFYGYRGRSPKSYLQTELNSELKAGKKYCMKFYVSFADMSKYASNNLGIYVSKEAVGAKNEGDLIFKPQIMNIRNKVMEQQFDWTPICGTYEATGGEKYITIGNFFTEENTATERVKKSREFSGAQTMDGYYYVDNVSVFDMEGMSPESCVCEKIAGGALETEFKSFSTSDKEKSENKGKTVFVNSDGTKEGAKTTAGETVKETPSKAWNVNDEVVYFDEKSTDLTFEAKDKLDKIVDYMNKNPKAQLKVIGHADKSEMEISLVGKSRAFKIKKYLEDQGLKGRIQIEGVEDKMPANPEGGSENRRATFKIIP